MNELAPRPRAKITRSRNGCLACRQRHRKCDEARPHCRTCVRLGLQCPGYTPVFSFRDATKFINRRSAVVERRKSATGELDGKEQQEQGLELMGQSAGLSQASLATDAPTVESVSVGARMIPAPTLIEQSGAIEYTFGHNDGTSSEERTQPEHDIDPVSHGTAAAHNFTGIGIQPGSFDGRGPVTVTRPGPPSFSSAGGGNWLRNPKPGSTLNDDHDAGGQSWDDTRAEDLVLPRSTTVDHNGHSQSCAAPLTKSRTSNNCAPPIDLLTFYPRKHDEPDHRLSENFPRQLPSIYQDIWEGAGYANLALKRALLAFDTLTKIRDSSAKDDRSQCLELYTLALQAMSGRLAVSLHITQVVVNILILTIFLHIEAKVGTFAGGLVHCRQADSLIVQHINQLAPWQTARRVLEAWVPIKSWYSLQCLPWSAMCQPLPETTRAPIFNNFQPGRHSRSLIHSLLCESKNTYIRLILIRLFGPTSSWLSPRLCSRQLEALLGTPIDRGGISTLGIEEDLLTSLDRLRDELDAWHDSLDVLDLPLPSATTQPQSVLRGHLSIPPAESLFFRSQNAAANYIRYATAQALCSREALDFATGGNLENGSCVNPWIIQILQIVSELDADLFLQDDLLNIGLEWIVYVLLFCSLQQEVMDAVAERFHWLQKIASAPGSTLPPWALSGLMSRLRKERIQGRVVLFFVTNIKPTEERWTVGSKSIKHSVMIMGRVARTGASFYDVEDCS